MLTVHIALGVALGLLLFGTLKGLLELPGQLAERRQRERQHQEFMQFVSQAADRVLAAAREAEAKKPVRRKPATKKAPVKKPVAKKTVTTKKGK